MYKEQIAELILQRKNQIDRLVHENYHRLAQQSGLSLDQFHLLIELDELNLNLGDEQQAPTINTLAQNVKVSQNTLSERVTRLEKKGLVKRVADERDRRISRVVLTEDGNALIDSVNARAETGYMRQALVKMSETELMEFLGCYDRLILLLKAHTDKEGDEKDGI